MQPKALKAYWAKQNKLKTVHPSRASSVPIPVHWGEKRKDEWNKDSDHYENCSLKNCAKCNSYYKKADKMYKQDQRDNHR